MKKQEQTILTTHSKRIDSVGELGAPASLEVLKEEASAWHRIYCAENSWTETGSRRWLQIEDELERTGTYDRASASVHSRRSGGRRAAAGQLPDRVVVPRGRAGRAPR